jgi:hypothetical protein
LQVIFNDGWSGLKILPACKDSESQKRKLKPINKQPKEKYHIKKPIKTSNHD